MFHNTLDYSIDTNIIKDIYLRSARYNGAHYKYRYCQIPNTAYHIGTQSNMSNSLKYKYYVCNSRLFLTSIDSYKTFSVQLFT